MKRLEMLELFLLILWPVSGVLGMPGVILSEYQDSLGQYSFGYSSPESARSEVRSADGKTRGAFSFRDAFGVIQSARYTADSESGFRIEATYLAEAPHDTPEVIAAREEHFKAVAEARKMSRSALGSSDGEVVRVLGSNDQQERSGGIPGEKKISSMSVKQKQEDLVGENPGLIEGERVKASENYQEAAETPSSAVAKNSEINPQSQAVLQPMGVTPSMPFNKIQRGVAPAETSPGQGDRGTAAAPALVGYSPYSRIYTGSIHPYGHYNFIPAATQFF